MPKSLNCRLYLDTPAVPVASNFTLAFFKIRREGARAWEAGRYDQPEPDGDKPSLHQSMEHISTNRLRRTGLDNSLEDGT